MIDVETEVMSAKAAHYCYAQGTMLLCTCGARVRRHITEVGLDDANDIPLFLIYKMLVGSNIVLHACTTAVIRLAHPHRH